MGSYLNTERFTGRPETGMLKRKMAKDLKEKRVAHYDKDSDVLYLGLKEGAEDALIEVAPGVGLEVDESGKILGIEILNASQVLKLVPKIERPAAV